MTDAGKALHIVADGLRPDAGGPPASIRRRRQADWTGAVALANAHFVGPALYGNLAQAQKLGDLPEDARDYLALLHRSNRLRNEALRRQTIELVTALDGIGVQPLLLKGSLALFVNHYVDSGTRMICDLDVLIPPHTAPAVFNTLHELGYEAKTHHAEDRHSFADFMRTNDPGAVDLHFELVDANYMLPAWEVWRDARILRHGDVEFLAPSPTHYALHHLLHAQVHYLGNFYRGFLELRQLHEFATLARHYREQIDWAFIAKRMGYYRLGIALESYTLAAERLLGLPYPLPSRPCIRARLHYRRCIAQFHSRLVAWLGIPWGNVRASFAWHRLNDLYTRESAAEMAIHHSMQYVLKKKDHTVFHRLFRIR